MAWMLLACVGQKGDSAAGEERGWQTVGESLPGAMLGIWGSSATDVWIVGADGGDGVNTRHFDGTAWSAELNGIGTLWWVSGQGDEVWLAGEGGQVGRRGEALTVLDPALTMFGVWAAAPDDAWAVGGNIDAAADAAALYRWDGAAWTRVELPAEAAAAAALYKVWGTSATDVWCVGTNRTIVHWDGSSWTYTASPVPGSLFTVHGSGTDVWAVGGDFTGEIVRWDGATWSVESPAGALQLTGVNGGYAVGVRGAVYVRGDGGWSLDARGQATREDLHSVWRDPDGGAWGVGGHTSSFPLLRGTLVYGGDATIPPM